MTITIRPYQQTDWQAVCRVHDASRQLEVKNFIPQGVILAMADYAEKDGFFESQVFVAVDSSVQNTVPNNHVLGFIAIKNDELTWLHIHPDNHRKGIGTALVNHIREKIGKDGFVLCALENDYGFPFYQKIGFKPAAYFPGNEAGYPCTCVRMTFEGSIHAQREPKPVLASLLAHGYTENDLGEAYQDASGVWHWRKKSNIL